MWSASLHPKLKDANAVTLGGTPYRQAELDAAPVMMWWRVSASASTQVEVPALNKRKIPLMTTGIANSVSVAEHAMYMLLASARLTRKHDRFVRENTWHQRLVDQPADLAGKSILVVGMGRIGSRTVKRCVAFEMDVYVLDPNISEADIKKAGATKVTDLKAILPKVDFVSVHCPKSPETVNMFNAETIGADEARRLPGEHRARRHRQRGGALQGADHRQAARRGARRARQASRPMPSNKLFGLENVIFSPHMAGVTKEANDRMAIAVMENILSVFDGQPIVAALREQGRC